MTGRGAGATIRHAEPADHATIVARVDAWWGGRRMADMLPKLFFVHFRPTSFVAEDNGRCVAFLVGFRSQTEPAQAYVHFVGVDPAWRGTGLGRELYARFFEAATALGCSEVQCVTSPANRASVAFHRALGFEALAGDAEADGVPFATDHDGPGESRVRFGKRLTEEPSSPRSGTARPSTSATSPPPRTSSTRPPRRSRGHG